MSKKLNNLIKDLNKVDVKEICTAWEWLLKNKKKVLIVSVMGDIFYLGVDEDIYWLQTDGGVLIKISNNIGEFEEFLNDEEKINEWFLPGLVDELTKKGKILKDSEVYSQKKMGVLGGDYSVENFEPTNISVHFAITGQISEQIKNLPDGTKVNIRVK